MKPGHPSRRASRLGAALNTVLGDAAAVLLLALLACLGWLLLMWGAYYRERYGIGFVEFLSALMAF